MKFSRTFLNRLQNQPGANDTVVVIDVLRSFTTAAVMLGLGVIMKDTKPDLILSGVNRGANLGDDITYSGTESAAMEGALAGVRSIALSQVYSKEGMADSVPFSAA